MGIQEQTQRPVPSIEAGWYPDPVDPARFRQWTGGRWTHVVYDGTLSRDRAIVEHLPFPHGMRAPEIAPRGRSRLPWLLAGAAAVVLLVVVLATTRTRSTSSGSISFGGVSAVDAADATTAPSHEVQCVRDAFARDDTLVGQAIAESNSTRAYEVNHAWSNLAEELALFDLSACSGEFAVAFGTYVEQVASYGSFVEGHTGMNIGNDLFSGDDVVQERSAVLAQVNSSYDELRDIGSDVGVDAPRLPLYVRD